MNCQVLLVKKNIKKEVKKFLETFPEITKKSSNREKLKHNNVLSIKLKNKVLPRYKKEITTNSIISKEKENICNKFLKGSIPKTINRDNNGLQTSLSSTNEDYAKNIDKLIKTVEIFSKMCNKILKVIRSTLISYLVVRQKLRISKNQTYILTKEIFIEII